MARNGFTRQECAVLIELLGDGDSAGLMRAQFTVARAEELAERGARHL